MNKKKSYMKLLATKSQSVWDYLLLLNLVILRDYKVQSVTGGLTRSTVAVSVSVMYDDL